MGNMKVAAITGIKTIEIKEATKPVADRNEVLVKIMSCALCTWEQRIFLGIKDMPLPFVGGHEVVGVIEALGKGVDEKEYTVGQKVAIRTLLNCGRCYYCRQGKENLCNESESLLDRGREFFGQGGLSEYMATDIRNIFKLNEGTPFTYGVFAEPLACVVNSVEQGKIELGNDIVIIGAGIMGLLHVMVSKLKGARVIVSEPDGERRKLAKELGADITFDPTEEKFVEKVKSLTEGRGADVVFNTTAIPAIAEQAINATSKLGRVVMYSSIHPDEPISISPNWIHNTQVEITGAVSPSIKSFKTSVELLSKGIIVPDKLTSGIYPLDKTQNAFEEAIKPDTFRIIVTND